MGFRWIVGISALVIAACAAFFSVTGIALLFSGATVGVAIMAGSLEFGKLVAASYLHREWSSLALPFKIYFTSAVVILIFITSMGIFGFLSNAYQKTSLAVESVEQEVAVLANKKDFLENEVNRFNERILTLNNQRQSQESRYDSLIAGENWVNARRAYELIESANEEIQELSSSVTSSQTQIFEINNQILSIQSQNSDITREIGAFRFIADAFNLPIDDAVKWFIIMLVFVFDPLAVSLVVAFNALRPEPVKTEEEIMISDMKTYIPKMAEEYKKKINKEKASKEEVSNVSSSDMQTKLNTSSTSEPAPSKSSFGVVSSKSQQAPNTKKPYL